MSEAPTTLDVPFRWAACNTRGNEPAQTGYFLFREERGRIGLRGAANMGATVFEGHAAGTEQIAESTMGNGSSVSQGHAVPRTKALPSQPEQRYILLKKYEGFVTARSDETFTTRLVESDGDYPVVEAEFDLEELSETDRALAVEGATLVWTIGYSYEGSTRKRESQIYLRRLPAWSNKEIQQAKLEAEALTRAIRWE